MVLPSSDYYHQGIDHPIMKAYQDILTNIAILLGADTARAARDMHDVIAFEIELSMVRARLGEINTYPDILRL